MPLPADIGPGTAGVLGLGNGVCHAIVPVLNSVSIQNVTHHFK